jgi:hypothetical protein
MMVRRTIVRERARYGNNFNGASAMSPVEIVTDIMFAGLSGTVGFFAARLGGEAWSRMILTSAAATRARTKLRRCAPLLPAFEQRRARLRIALAQSEARRRSVERQIDQFQSKLEELQQRDDELIRIVGRKRPGCRLFKAVMVNRHVQAALREGRPHGLLDGSWARAQHVEIWAQNLPEAKASLDSRFPVSLGFILIEMIEPEEPSGAAADGKGAAA